jgi:hypothetical protein
MELAARLDDIPKPLWIGFMVLGFALYWPVGLALLAYLLWSGRMGCWKHSRRFWRDEGAFGRWHDGRRGGSGNRAFDDYRQETLRRLEEEQRQFMAFLERLRLAKDKEEFDVFLAERQRATDTPPPPPPPN